MQVSVFDKAAEMFSGDSCKMARLVGTKSCQEVYARLQKVGDIRQLCFADKKNMCFVHHVANAC